MPLRTYTAEIDGLNQWVVAAPNQTAALEAFGVHQNLFAQGLAGLTKDADLVKAANARPGVPLKRPKTGGKFTAAGGGSDWSDALKATARDPRAKKPPSRAGLDRARAALAAAQADAERRLAALDEAVAAAQARRDAAQDKADKALARAEAAVEAAEQAYRKAGG